MNNHNLPFTTTGEPPAEMQAITPEIFDLFRSLFFDPMPLPVWCLSTHHQEAMANTFWQQTMARLPTEQSSDWMNWLHPEDYAAARNAWDQATRNNDVFRHNLRLAISDGSYRWFVAYGYTLPALTCKMVTFFDTDQLREDNARAYNNWQTSKSMLDASIDCIKLINTKGELIDMNSSGCKALGVSADSGFGMEWLKLLPPEIEAPGREALQQAREGHNARFSGKSEAGDGPPMFWDNILTPVKTPAGEVSGILCVSRDITELHLAEQRFKFISEHDELTGLPNRRMFNASLKASLQHGHPLAVIVIDLDYFKLVNDTLGHPAGDHLLEVVAQRLQQAIPEKGFIARIGGDEFAAVLPGITSAEELLSAGQSLIQQTTQPLCYQGQAIHISLSVGGALYPQQAADCTTMIKAADIALNELKRSGRGGICCYESSMAGQVDKIHGQMELAKEIVSEEKIFPYYQPKVRLSDGKIVGMEALMRFFNRKGELCFPGHIWAAFENYSLVERIGYLIRDKVFSDIRQWIDQSLEVVPVSVNASPVEFMRDNYAETVLAQIRHYNLPPGLVEIEITEHMFDGRGACYVFRALNLLKAEGVRISLDDFGTGYSALANIRDYPVDVIKVDRTFVDSLSKGKEGLAVVKALLLLATELEMDVVAEGIEYAEQRDSLLNEGYQLGQGFLFSAAVPASDITRFLNNLDQHKLL